MKEKAMRKAMFGLLVVVAAVGLSLSIASAQADYPVSSGGLSVQQDGQTTTNLSFGSSVTVTGGGFAPGAAVDVVIDSTPVLLGTVFADGTGWISATFTIPSSIGSGPHTITATGAGAAGGTMVLSIQVSVGVAGAIALTGRSFTSIVAAGAAALIVGGLLILVTRPATRRPFLKRTTA